MVRAVGIEEGVEVSPRNHVEAGRHAKASGDQFEVWMEGQLDHAMRLGILACWHHNEPKVKVYDGKVNYDKKSVADYSATFERHGLGVSGAFEAKSTSAKNFPLNEVSLLQQRHLEAVAKAGGIALLVVEFRSAVAPLFQRFAIPWLDVPWIVLKTAKTINVSLLNQWVIPPGTCFLSRWHTGGPRSSPIYGARNYPVE